MKRKYIRDVLLGISCFLFGVLITGNVLSHVDEQKVAAESVQENPLKIIPQTKYDDIDVYTLKDYDTNVQYIVVRNHLSNGGISITERKNADGSLYGSKLIENN